MSATPSSINTNMSASTSQDSKHNEQLTPGKGSLNTRFFRYIKEIPECRRTFYFFNDKQSKSDPNARGHMIKLMYKLSTNLYSEESYFASLGTHHTDVDFHYTPQEYKIKEGIRLQLWDGHYGGERKLISSYKAPKIAAMVCVDLSNGYINWWLVRQRILEIKQDMQPETKIILIGTNCENPIAANNETTLRDFASKNEIPVEDIFMVSAKTSENCDKLLERMEEIAIQSVLADKKSATSQRPHCK